MEFAAWRIQKLEASLKLLATNDVINRHNNGDIRQAMRRCLVCLRDRIEVRTGQRLFERKEGKMRIDVSSRIIQSGQ